MKAVPDTMMWVSYCTSSRGRRYRILERAFTARVRLFVSPYILDELVAVLTEDLGYSRRFAHLARKAVLRRAKLVRLPPSIRSYVAGDPDDDAIVQTAITSRADFIVTADNVLISLAKVQDVEIISLTEFESRLPATR